MATGQLEDNGSSASFVIDGHPNFELITSDFVPSLKQSCSPRKPDIASGLDDDDSPDFDEVRDGAAKTLVLAQELDGSHSPRSAFQNGAFD